MSKQPKYSQLFDDLEDIFRASFSLADLERNVNLCVINTLNLPITNGLPTKVAKASPKVKYHTGGEENGFDVEIEVNGAIFEMLNPAHQAIIAEETIAQISYSFESDKVTITKPDYQVMSLIAQKHGHDIMEGVRETVKACYTQKRDQEDETKAIVG